MMFGGRWEELADVYIRHNNAIGVDVSTQIFGEKTDDKEKRGWADDGVAEEKPAKETDSVPSGKETDSVPSAKETDWVPSTKETDWLPSASPRETDWAPSASSREKEWVAAATVRPSQAPPKAPILKRKVQTVVLPPTVAASTTVPASAPTVVPPPPKRCAPEDKQRAFSPF